MVGVLMVHAARVPLYSTEAQLLVTYQQVIDSRPVTDALSAARSANRVGAMLASVIHTDAFLDKAVGAGFGLNHFIPMTREAQRIVWRKAVSAGIASDSNILTVKSRARTPDQADVIVRATVFVLLTQGEYFHGSGRLIRLTQVVESTKPMTRTSGTMQSQIVGGALIGMMVALGLITIRDRNALWGVHSGIHASSPMERDEQASFVTLYNTERFPRVSEEMSVEPLGIQPPQRINAEEGPEGSAPGSTTVVPASMSFSQELPIVPASAVSQESDHQMDLFQSLPGREVDAEGVRAQPSKAVIIPEPTVDMSGDSDRTAEKIQQSVAAPEPFIPYPSRIDGKEIPPARSHTQQEGTGFIVRTMFQDLERFGLSESILVPHEQAV